MYNGVSGFDNQSVLSGRPYGGCGILWRSDICVNVVPISVDSKRICADLLSTNTWKLVIINVYMHFESGDSSTDEFRHMLSVLEDIIFRNADSQRRHAGFP